MFASVAELIPGIEKKLGHPLLQEQFRVLDSMHYRLLDDIAWELMAGECTGSIEDVIIARYLRPAGDKGAPPIADAPAAPSAPGAADPPSERDG